jgi:hypothetical protein
MAQQVVYFVVPIEGAVRRRKLMTRISIKRCVEANGEAPCRLLVNEGCSRAARGVRNAGNAGNAELWRIRVKESGDN